jgi:hypothetical protein
MDVLTPTRRLLHGVAEGLLAGPQHRTCGRIQLRVVPGGFATTGDPAIRLDGADLVVDEERRVPLSGRFAGVGAATGHGYGEPTNYHDHSGVRDEEDLALDPTALEHLSAWFVRADAALRILAPTETPVLWPEHFDVAVLLMDRSVGASPGDGFCPTPYAYVGDSTMERNDYWNAPFGAYLAFEQVPPVGALVAFWTEGLRRLASSEPS